MKLPPNTTIPAVAMPREPNRSDRMPETGPEIRKPAVSGSRKMPAHSGVSAVVVAVQRQPDALQPDDQHELQAAAGDGDQHSPAMLPAVKARIRNRLSWNIGSATLLSITTNAASSADAADQQADDRRGSSSPWCVPVGLDAAR